MCEPLGTAWSSGPGEGQGLQWACGASQRGYPRVWDSDHYGERGAGEEVPGSCEGGGTCWGGVSTGLCGSWAGAPPRMEQRGLQAPSSRTPWGFSTLPSPRGCLTSFLFHSCFPVSVPTGLTVLGPTQGPLILLLVHHLARSPGAWAPVRVPFREVVCRLLERGPWSCCCSSWNPGALVRLPCPEDIQQLCGEGPGRERRPPANKQH